MFSVCGLKAKFAMPTSCIPPAGTHVAVATAEGDGVDVVITAVIVAVEVVVEVAGVPVAQEGRV